MYLLIIWMSSYLINLSKWEYKNPPQNNTSKQQLNWSLRSYDERDAGGSAKKILGYKSDIWRYEDEHRIQFDLSVLKRAKDNRGKELLTFEVPKKSIRRIIFGCRLT